MSMVGSARCGSAVSAACSAVALPGLCGPWLLRRPRPPHQASVSLAALPTSSRRAFAGAALGTTAVLVGALAVGGTGVALAATVFGRDPRTLTQSGMNKFRQNKVEESVTDFDDVIAVSPSSAPYMWQRGLSLYYLGRYQEGAEQFRKDVAVNPNDTEESIWTFLCEAQLLGPEQARKQFLQVGRDPRPVMRAAYECFQKGEDPAKIMAAVSDNGGHDSFYGQLYVGLWHEAHGDAEGARAAITAAVRTTYAQQSGDYMASLARVHCLRRGWQA